MHLNLLNLLLVALEQKALLLDLLHLIALRHIVRRRSHISLARRRDDGELFRRIEFQVLGRLL